MALSRPQSSTHLTTIELLRQQLGDFDRINALPRHEPEEQKWSRNKFRL
jgi:hypothetical protein